MRLLAQRTPRRRGKRKRTKRKERVTVEFLAPRTFLCSLTLCGHRDRSEFHHISLCDTPAYRATSAPPTTKEEEESARLRPNRAPSPTDSPLWTASAAILVSRTSRSDRRVGDSAPLPPTSIWMVKEENKRPNAKVNCVLRKSDNITIISLHFITILSCVKRP